MTKPATPLNEPEIGYMPAFRMAAVYARGHPEQAIPGAIYALYNALFTLKFENSITGGQPIQVEALRVRHADTGIGPSYIPTIVVGLPVPDEIKVLPQQVGGLEVRLEKWSYGQIAQIRHDGSLIDGLSPSERLQQFIEKNGYAITGVREEEFPIQPSEPPESIIRYRITEK